MSEFDPQAHHELDIIVVVNLRQGLKVSSKEMIILGPDARSHKFSDIAQAFQSELYNVILTEARKIVEGS